MEATSMDNQQQDISGSPHSSEEVESHHGTPATKLSTFSPDDIRTEQKVSESALRQTNLPPAFTLRSDPIKSSHIGRMQVSSLFGNPDPFTTASSASFQNVPKLSPSASTFTPLSLQRDANERIGRSIPTVALSALKVNDIPLDEGFHTAPLQQTSQPELKKLLYSVANSALVSPTSQSPTWSVESSSTRNGHGTDFGHFSSGSNVSRYLMISQVAQNTSIDEFEAFFDVSGYDFSL